MCRSFLQEDLVDELYLGLGPVLLGDGVPGFPGKFPQRDFKLTECKSYANEWATRHNNISIDTEAVLLTDPF